MRKSLIISVLALLTLKADAQLIGQYTVGGTAPDYATVNDAVNDVILQGIQGPVTFMIRPGAYSAFLTFPEINYSFVVEFRSETGNAADVELKMSNLYECRNVTFRHLTIIPRRNTNYMYNYKGLEISGSSLITFDSCVVRGTSDPEERIGFTVAADWGDIRFTNCRFRNLDYAVVYSASTHYYGSNRHWDDHLVQHCDFDSVLTGFRIAGDFGTSSGDSMRIYDCTLRCDIGLVVDGVAEDITGLLVFRNVFNCTNAGILVSNNWLTNPYHMPLFVNNMISAPTAFSSTVSQYFGFYNNSVYGQCGFGAYLWAYNNSFQYSGTSPVFLIENSAAYYGNHNNFYSPNSAPQMFVINGQWSIPIPDLAAFKTATAQDTASISADPMYFSTTDLHSYSPYLKFNGRPLPFVGTDIDGELRNPFPDIGADEFHASPLPPYAFFEIVCNTAGNYSATLVDTSVRATTFSWNFGDANTSVTESPSHTWAGPGPYTITQIVSNPFGTDTLAQVIQFPASVPAVTVNGSMLSVTNGPYTAFQWYYNGSPIANATASSFNAPFNGNYSVMVWDATCTCPYESAPIAVGTEEYEWTQVMISPNPVTDYLNISIVNPGAGEVSYAIYDVTGRLMDELTAQGTQQHLNLESYARGTYVLKVTNTETQQVSSRLIIKL